MSKNKRKNSKRKLIKEGMNFSTEIKNNKEETYSKTIDIREKRINIVFKIVYVFAIFFAVIFIDMGKKIGNVIDTMYIFEACLTTFFLVLIGYMVFYIINEMKCLKLYENDLSKEQITITEKSYSYIFSVFNISGYTLLVCLLAFTYGSDDYNAEILIKLFWMAFVIRMIIFSIASCLKEKYKEFLEHYIGCILITVAIVSILYAVGLNTTI